MPLVSSQQRGQAAMMDERRSLLVTFVALLLGSCALALGPWLVREAGVGAVSSGLWRMALAVPMLGLFALASGRSLKPPPRRLTILLALAGILFALDLAAWHLGIHLTKLGNATLFGNVGSFIFALYGLWLLKRWPTMRQSSALALAAIGSLLLLSESLELSADHFRGDLLALLAAVLYAGYLIIVDGVRKQLDPVTLLFWASLFGAAAMWPMALVAGETILPDDWTMVIALAFTSQFVGQGLVVYAIGRLPPLVVGLTLLTQPAISAALGWGLYGESFTAMDVAGALAVAMALVLVRLRPRPSVAT